MRNMEEESIAIHTSPADYSHHVGEVASVGVHSLKVILRKLSMKEPYHLDRVPLSTMSRAEYKSGPDPFRIVAGILLVALLCGIFYFVGVYWDSLEPRTRVPVGLLGLAGLYGLRWAFMSRRHSFVFHLQNGDRTRWKSTPGDFKYKQRPVEHVIQFLRGKGLVI